MAMHHTALGLALLGYSVATRAVLALVVGCAVVEDRHLLRAALLYPLRDLLGFCYWASSYGSREIVWRNQIYKLAEGGRMLPRDGTEGEHARPVVPA